MVQGPSLLRWWEKQKTDGSSLGCIINGRKRQQPVNDRGRPEMTEERKSTDVFSVNVGAVFLDAGDIYVSERDLLDLIEKRGDAGLVVYHQGKMMSADGETTRLFRIPQLASSEQIKRAVKVRSSEQKEYKAQRSDGRSFTRGPVG